MPRDYGHDYRSRCIYHVTMTKAHGIPVFSRISGSPESVIVERSPLGSIIEQQIRNFPNLYPTLKILQYVIMPDHIHFAIFAESILPKALGSYIGMILIHRADSETLKANKQLRWLYLAENGGVLVSPFISPAEKAIRRQCEEVNGKVILLRNTPFKEKEKPAAHDFTLCSEGRLLILAPMSPLPSDRKTFLYLNSVAESLSAAIS